MSKQKAALEQFVVDNEELERLETLLAQFNIFEAIGVVRQEIRHSNFLAFLLNPTAAHRLGDTFLKRFLKRILVDIDPSPISPVEIDVADLTDAEVRREWRYIDILVFSSSSKIACVIENKVDSQEHSDQLSRYREIVLKKFQGYRCIFIYLTPTGMIPGSEEDQKNWIPCRYDKIANLIDDTCQKYQSTIGSEVLTLMSHYSSLIRRHIVGDSEISELCRKIYKQHKQALDLIYMYRPDLGLEIAEFFKELIQDSASSNLIEDFHSNGNTRKLIRFTVQDWNEFSFQSSCNKWTKSQRILLFEIIIQLPSVSLVLMLGPGELATKQDIYDACAMGGIPNLGDRPTQSSGWAPLFWREIIEVADVSIDDIAEELQTFWKSFLEGDLPVIKQAIAANENLQKFKLN